MSSRTAALVISRRAELEGSLKAPLIWGSASQPVFVNKGTESHVFVSGLSVNPFVTMTELKSFDRDCMTGKDVNIYYLALY